jgi:hypothetical protein
MELFRLDGNVFGYCSPSRNCHRYVPIGTCPLLSLKNLVTIDSMLGIGTDLFLPVFAFSQYPKCLNHMKDSIFALAATIHFDITPVRLAA